MESFRGVIPDNWDLGLISWILTLILGFFIVVPVGIVLVRSFFEGGNFTFRFVNRFFSTPVYVNSLRNSVYLAIGLTLTSSCVALPYAYLVHRTQLPLKNFFQYGAIVPFMLPSYLAALGYIFVLGNAGTVNLLLEQYFGVSCNFIYHIPGIVFIQTFHIFPIIYLTLSAGFNSLDPSLEESARDLGAGKFEVFRTISFPILLPSFLSGAFLTFALSMRILGVPLIIGFWNLMAPQILQTTTGFNETLIKTGSFGMVLLIAISTIILLFVRGYLSRREYATSKPSGRSKEYVIQELRGWKKFLGVTFCSLVMFLGMLPFIAIILMSISSGWGRTPFPTQFSLTNWVQLIQNSSHFIINSLKYSSLAVLGALTLGFTLAYIVERTDFRGKSVLDAVAMVALFIPGSAIALGYLQFFSEFNFPLLGKPLVWSWMVLPIGYLFRRLPYALRSSSSSLQLIDESLEEASRDLGASRYRTLREIVLPLSKQGLIAGAIMVFIFTTKDVPITVWLTPGSQAGNLTWAIFDHAGIGGFPKAAVLGTIMVLILILSVMIGLRIFGIEFGKLFKMK